MSCFPGGCLLYQVLRRLTSLPTGLTDGTTPLVDISFIVCEVLSILNMLLRCRCMTLYCKLLNGFELKQHCFV